MKSEIVSIHITSEEEQADSPSFATVGDLTLHCTHIQNRKEVVVTVNPSITGHSAASTELTHTAETTFKIFDIHQRQTHALTVGGKKYEIEFLTWSRPKPDTLRFDFEVRFE